MPEHRTQRGGASMPDRHANKSRAPHHSWASKDSYR